MSNVLSRCCKALEPLFQLVARNYMPKGNSPAMEISSPRLLSFSISLGGCVAIQESRHSGRGMRRIARSGIQKNQTPRSSPSPLAMETVPQLAVRPSTRSGPRANLFLLCRAPFVVSPSTHRSPWGSRRDERSAQDRPCRTMNGLTTRSHRGEGSVRGDPGW
jgi:hypothetical protein